jgi:hypothetical protein
MPLNNFFVIPFFFFFFFFYFGGFGGRPGHSLSPPNPPLPLKVEAENVLNSIFASHK